MYERRAEQKSQGKIIVKIIWTPVSNLKKREREKEETGLNNLQRCQITSSFYNPSGVGRAFPGGHWWMLQLGSVLEEHLFSFTTCCGVIAFKELQLCVCKYVPVCAQSCLTLCNPMDCGPSECGFSVDEIFQARILEWVAISSSRESFWTKDQTCVTWISYIRRQILYHYATWEAHPCATVLLSVLFLPLGRGTGTGVRSRKTILIHWLLEKSHSYVLLRAQHSELLLCMMMVGWHHWLNGHEFEQTPGDSEGQGSWACCSPWGCKELDTT